MTCTYMAACQRLAPARLEQKLDRIPCVNTSCTRCSAMFFDRFCEIPLPYGFLHRPMNTRLVYYGINVKDNISDTWRNDQERISAKVAERWRSERW